MALGCVTVGDVFYWGLLAVVGLACGLMNTLASSGSAVSLPVLMMLGLAEGAANATNRLPVLVGALMSTLSFALRGQIDWSAALRLMPVAAAGSVLGVIAAEQVPDRQMGYLITGAVLVALLLLFTKVKEALSKELSGPAKVTPKALVLTFGIGFWLGLLVLDGATYLMMVLILVCSYDLPRANGLKVLLIAVTSLLPIALFARAGEILWLEGGVLALGSVVGGYLGVVLSNLPQARTLAFKLLVVAIMLELAHLIWHYTAPLRAQM